MSTKKPKTLKPKTLKPKTLKHRGKGPQAITANDLRSGKVVYLNPSFTWTHHLSKALVSGDANVIEKMQQVANRDDKNNLVVGVYMIDMDAGSKLPTRYREKFRMHGPSYSPGYNPGTPTETGA